MSSPIIFEKGTRDFSTLGLGLLSDAIQATTTEELNGQFIFEMDYPVSGNNADLIKENRIIVVNSGHILKRQGFIIRQIVRKIDLTMTVYAEHVSYATLDVALAPVGTISGDAKTALENWKRMLVPTVDFTVDSDILTTNSTLIGAPEFETARQGLGGHTGSILDVWGGEYQFDNWHIRLLKQRGKSANAIIAYGRNLISFEQDTNIADTYTSVYPYYQENSGDEGNKTHFLPERTVDSEFVGKYPNPKVLMLDLSNKFKDVADYSENKLRNYALSYIQSNNIGVPKVNMKISTVDLSRATGGFSEDIDLGDTVKVYFEKLGITTSAKVIKAVWNVLSDDYDKFEIGARRSSLTESISELATTADENANKALNQALVALQSADGKSTIYYLNSSDPWPTNPNENDTAFVKDGENGIMYRYMFNNDTGMFSWVKILDSMSADQIKQRVSDALESGKAYSDQLVADNVAQVNTVLDDVQAKQADLSSQQAELDTKAQGYANKALDDAKADTLATAAQIAKDAQEYTDTAKADAISASTTADGVINKKIDDTASSITSTISQNKTDADGKITTAQNTATQALNGLATKVSQTVYDAKTGQLQTDLNTTTTTANQAKTDIVSIKSDNTKQDARMTTIESDANGTKTTVSNLQTDLGKANGSISTLQQRADGFDATVTKVNNLSVGGRNLFLNSKMLSNRYGPNGNITATVEPFDSTTNMWHIVAAQMSGAAVGIILWNYANNKIATNNYWSYSADIKGVGIPSSFGIERGRKNPVVGKVTSDWSRISQTGYIDSDVKNIVMYFNTSNSPLDVYIKLPKLEIGNLPTQWSPAPEDTDNKISTVSQTVDSISSIVSDPTTGLTKRVQTAEGSISTVQSNVSDLQSKQTQTANGLTTEISNRATGDSNTLTQAKDFTTSSISNSESGMRSLITQTSDAIIAKVDTKTDSSTVLSLLKDNWSIGIADNAGALASGIAGDLNSMTLISKKITLDGNTTVTGDFYAKGGNFKNINASNITVGNLDADEVRIINLDVNTLTGDVSRFLETNWDGVYGSTSITSTGMVVRADRFVTSFKDYGMGLEKDGVSVGFVSVDGLTSAPQYIQGVNFKLDGQGDYMSWSARDEGVETGVFGIKMAWYRKANMATTGNQRGFEFSDQVTFKSPINVPNAVKKLGFKSVNLYGTNFPYFGNSDRLAGLAYTDDEIYMILGNVMYNMSNVIKALSGLGTWSVPTNIDSTGKVTKWRNVTT
ncbi:gp58-like family protein [Leuconostoc lactis]|uniref:phage tail spike protein n=1 Tax=Leuconostoc lactis TaxID=1246 RepID=UPI00272CD916|nr:phage tail spike protein [Leuconostoc lactis]WKY79053.1 gp58-like family protein [Leuconostoc lactis]